MRILTKYDKNDKLKIQNILITIIEMYPLLIFLRLYIPVGLLLSISLILSFPDFSFIQNVIYLFFFLFHVYRSILTDRKNYNCNKTSFFDVKKIICFAEKGGLANRYTLFRASDGKGCMEILKVSVIE